MADATIVVNNGENSPQQVAFKLLQIIAASEGKTLQNSGYDAANADRKWVLDTYAECLHATNGYRSVP